MFSLLIDLDAFSEPGLGLRWLSFNRFNLFSVHESDHGDQRPAGLRQWVDLQRRAAGLPCGGRVRMLTMPRVLGHGFNPLTVYFMDAPEGGLQAILYEVRNTFGERHWYLLPVPAVPSGDSDRSIGQAAGQPIVQRCAKRFHVSPFLPMAMDYRFAIQPPDAVRGALSIAVTVMEADRPTLSARFRATERPLSDGHLLRVALTHPVLTLKVVAGIHWEALKLWLKGIRLHPRPPAPAQPVSITPPESR